MLKVMGGYRMVENEEDFIKHFNESFQSLDGGVIDEKPTKYPAFYHYCPPDDYHYSGHCFKTDKEKFITALKKEIQEYEEDLIFLKKILDNLIII